MARHVVQFPIKTLARGMAGQPVFRVPAKSSITFSTLIMHKVVVAASVAAATGDLAVMLLIVP